MVVYRAATATSELAVIDRELELVFPKASTNHLCHAVRTQTADGLIKSEPRRPGSVMVIRLSLN